MELCYSGKKDGVYRQREGFMMKKEAAKSYLGTRGVVNKRSEVFNRYKRSDNLRLSEECQQRSYPRMVYQINTLK